MKLDSRFVPLVLSLVLAAGCGASQHAAEHADTASPETAPPVEQTPDEQVAGLERMCADARPAIAERQAAARLFDRVGGRDGIRAVVADTVRRHRDNAQIKHLLEQVDTDHLVAQVTDFLVVGTGGEGEYHGRDMVLAHAHLKLTNGDFIAAGDDLGEAMKAAGWGENERQELLCAFVDLRGQVVTR